MTYRFSKDSRGSLLATRTEPAHPDTKGLFINEKEDGYGATGITGDWRLPRQAIAHYDFFEYQNGETREYHRINLSDMVFGGETPEPLALEVRHQAWPGMDATEIRLQLTARRARRIAAAIEAAKARKRADEKRKQREEEEARVRAEIEAEIEGAMSEEDAITAALREAGLEDYA